MTHRFAFVHLVMAVLVLCTVVSAAPPATPTGWSTPLGPGKTAIDGARRIFPGGTLDGDTFELTEDKILRMPGTSKDRADLPAGTTLQAPDSVTIRAQGRRYTLLMWDGERPTSSENGGFGDSIAVLAVFPEGSAEPTDVAEVRQDRETYLIAGGTPTLGPDDTFTVVNTHLNAGEEFVITSLFHLRDRRLRRIAEVFTESAMGCTGSVVETPSWKIGAVKGGEYPELISVVDVVKNPAAYTKDCEAPRPKERRLHYEDRYRWDALKKQYVLVGSPSRRR